jgi:hypothetical protein
MRIIYNKHHPAQVWFGMQATRPRVGRSQVPSGLEERIRADAEALRQHTDLAHIEFALAASQPAQSACKLREPSEASGGVSGPWR